MAVLTSVALPAFSEEFWVDNMRYSTDGNTATLLPKTDKGSWSPYEDDHYSFMEVEVPESVTYNGNQIPVTVIGRGAFRWCLKLTKVKLPKTIKRIEVAAFYNTPSLLENIEIPKGVEEIQAECFGNCPITHITIPAGVKEISPEIFWQCSELESVTIEGNVTSIGDKAFGYCSKLQTLKIPNTVTYIGEWAFYGCSLLNNIEIPESVKTIGEEAFRGCTSLTSIKIPSSVEEMGTGVFSGCTSLAEVVLPQSFKQIMDYTFYGCSALKSVTLPDGLVRIGTYAFHENSSLEISQFPSSLEYIEEDAFRDCKSITTELKLPNIKEIGNRAFYYCTGLTSVIFGDKLKKLGDAAFYNCTNITKVDIGDLKNWCEVDFVMADAAAYNNFNNAVTSSNPLVYAKKIYLKGKELNSLNIPAGVTKIPANVFNGCSRFMSLVIPNTVTEIGDCAFNNCSDLTTVTFSKGISLEKIGNRAFANNPCLTKMQLPATLKSLGDAFYWCKNLESVNLPDGLTTIANNTFYGCEKLNGIIIPEGVTRIGTTAFYECNSLETINIPSSVESIGTDCFKLCRGLKGVYITDLAAWCAIKHANPDNGSGTGMAWSPVAGDGNPLMWAQNLYLNGELVTDLVISGSITTVEGHAFRGATCLKSITLEEGVTTLGMLAFSGCTSLEVIRIPKSLKNVETRWVIGPSFSSVSVSKGVYIKDLESWINNNIGLSFIYPKMDFDLYLNDKLVTDLVIPENITEIPENAFSYINSIKTVTLPKTLETLNSDAIYKCNNLTAIYSKSIFAPDGTGLRHNDQLKKIYVPMGSGANYRAKWTYNGDIIYEVPADMTLTGTQTADGLTEIKAAYNAVNDTEMTYVDLTESTLDESVTSETLKTGDTNSNTVYFLPSGTTSVTGDNIVVDGQAASIVLEDCQPFGAPTEFTASSAFYSRTQGVAGKWATICLPFSCDIPDGITVEEFERFDGNSVIFRPVTSIEAGKPYLFKADDGVSEVIAQAENVTVLPVSEVEGKTAEFIGVLSQTITFDSDFRESGCTYYGINADANEFQRLGEKATCQPFRAYLKVKDTQSAKHSAYKVIHGGDGGTTGIIDAADGTDGSKTIYNVSGQRLNAPQKGINIINGKKVIIK